MKNTRDVHVVYLVTKLELGGAQKVCLALFKGLKDLGVSTSLITGSDGVLVSEVSSYSDVYLLKNFKREIGFGMMLSEIQSVFEIVHILKKIKKEHKEVIVHTHSTKAGIVGRLAAFLAGIPYRVHTVHGFGFHDYQTPFLWWVSYTLESIVAWLTTCFIVVSNVDRREGIKRLPRFAYRNKLIRAAIDQAPFKNTGNEREYPATGEFVIGTISCFKPQKNLLDLLHAFNEVKKNLVTPEMRARLKLEIVGDGEQRSAIERFISEHGLEADVRLLGWQADVAPLLLRWNLFAMSSLWEGLPCAVVEASCARLPVVAYNVGGICELIGEGEQGYLVMPGDWYQLAQKIALVVNDPFLWKKLVLGSDEETLKEFDISEMLSRHHDLYHQLVAYGVHKSVHEKIK